MVYLIDYRAHYRDILREEPSPRQMAELFMFRGWTVQFGYRIFSSDPGRSEKIISECVNLYRTLGLGSFDIKHKLKLEEVLAGDFMDLLDDRWQSYDAMAKR